jgi:hypothetical protein
MSHLRSVIALLGNAAPVGLWLPKPIWVRLANGIARAAR